MNCGGDERAQTTLDYAIGVGVFLLTLAFVFALFPAVFSPFQTPVSTAETVGAQRVADQVQEEITGPGVRLNTTATTEFFSETSADELRERYGLPPFSHVNVTLHGRGETMGHRYGDAPVVIARRIVVGTGCDPACELEVRVW
ncbi:DUF7287 family protein [Halobaculum sp. P14]|uniref:DUF7287 family protein n=1 Tax=Halobaculum sp. P14 TaxID=3421638 RepID=UPI003EB98BD5